jgi:hypothetical protein
MNPVVVKRQNYPTKTITAQATKLNRALEHIDCKQTPQTEFPVVFDSSINRKY